MNRNTLLGTALAVLALSGVSQAAEDPVRRQIEVVGEARIQVPPTVATITLGVTETDREAANAMQAVSRAMVAVIDRLQAAGVAAEDMQTEQVSLSPQWSRPKSYDSDGRQEITGFTASNSLRLRVRDLDRLGEVLDQVLRVGANEFHGLRFGVADSSAVQDQIRGDAVEDAIRKARQLAEAAGMDLGPAQRITDQPGSGGGPQPMMMEMARSAPVPVEAGMLEFQHAVSVVFDMVVPDPKTGD